MQGVRVQSLVRELDSHMLQLKIQHALSKTWYSQINNLKKKTVGAVDPKTSPKPCGLEQPPPKWGLPPSHCTPSCTPAPGPLLQQSLAPKLCLRLCPGEPAPSTQPTTPSYAGATEASLPDYAQVVPRRWRTPARFLLSSCRQPWNKFKKRKGLPAPPGSQLVPRMARGGSDTAACSRRGRGGRGRWCTRLLRPRRSICTYPRQRPGGGGEPAGGLPPPCWPCARNRWPGTCRWEGLGEMR